MIDFSLGQAHFIQSVEDVHERQCELDLAAREPVRSR
jgi:adenosine/AMP kinase